MERIADYIIKKIAETGTSHIFLVTGRGILYLSDAAAKSESVTGVPMLHEQSASYAAMAYAKASGGMGACLVSTGCAAANAVTGCLCAYQDNLPVVFISGQHMLRETTRYTKAPIRTYGSQEADIIGMVKPITKYAVMLTDASQTVYEVEKALYLAREGRKGPVWIDVPLDLQSTVIEPERQRHYIPESVPRCAVDSGISAVARELAHAKRPILMIGGGACECRDKVRAFVEEHRMPLVYTASACDIYGSGNELSIGAVASLGAPRAGNFALQNADYVLVLGSKLCSQSIGANPNTVARDAKITVVDIDPSEHTKAGIRIDRLLICDAKYFLEKLAAHETGFCDAAWTEKCLHWKKLFDIQNEKFIKAEGAPEQIDLYDFCSRLGGRIGDKTAVITDAGLEELIVPSTIPFRSGQICFFPAAQGAMGYAVPAIVGAFYGGCRDIVVVVGDGSIMMNVQELQLLSYHHIPARIFVINNGMYAVIRGRQKELFRKRTIGNDASDGVPAPDFKKLADAFGLAYQVIEDAEKIREGLDAAMRSTVGLLCEVMCKTEQRYFHTSFRRNENGRIIRPPIEDMSPFLDRELFSSEMIVEPLET